MPYEDTKVVKINGCKDGIVVKEQIAADALGQCVEPGLVADLVDRPGLLLDVFAEKAAEIHAIAPKQQTISSRFAGSVPGVGPPGKVTMS
jgi:hypothetical protein